MAVITDYPKDEVEACYSVLLELAITLGAYRESIILIGGWVPFLLSKDNPSRDFQHCGSLDVDLLIDPTKISKNVYRTIEKLLKERGYYQKPDDQHNLPFVFYRNTKTKDGRAITIKIDLLAGEYGGTGKTRRHQRIQGLLARKARGSDIAYSNFTTIRLSGRLPNGAKVSMEVKIADIVAILVMKGMALGDRFKEKDAYDVYYLCRNSPGAPDAVIRALKSHREQGLVKEGLMKIKEFFADIDGLGPVGVVNFLKITNTEEKMRKQRDVYEVINYILEKLGI